MVTGQLPGNPSYSVDKPNAQSSGKYSTQGRSVGAGIWSMTQQADDDYWRFMTVIRTAARFQLREKGQALEARYVRFNGTVGQTNDRRHAYRTAEDLRRVKEIGQKRLAD